MWWSMGYGGQAILMDSPIMGKPFLIAEKSKRKQTNTEKALIFSVEY